MLNSSAIDSFHTDGYVIIPGLLSPTEVDEVRANLTRLVSEADELGGSPAGWHVDFETGDAASRELRVRKFRDIGLADEYFWGLVRHPLVLAALDSLIGIKPQLLQTMALVKPPDIGSAKDWHQDLPYFPLENSAAVVGVWIAIDDATIDNGCMQVVPGSHHLGLVTHIPGPTGWRIDPRACDPLRSSMVPLPMTAGSALLFDGSLFHFTDTNRSRLRRRAVQNHYASAATSIATGRTGRLFDLDTPVPPFLCLDSAECLPPCPKLESFPWSLRAMGFIPFSG